MFDVHSNDDHEFDNFFDYFLYRHILLDLLYPDNCRPLAVRYIVLEIKGKVWSHIVTILRIVQTQAILYLKSMSERGGSDVQRP